MPDTLAENTDGERVSLASQVSDRLLQGRLSQFLYFLIFVQLALWIPHYLSWPYWADHDVFATMARAWLDGRLPYREMLCNNFPGTIYLFGVLGSLFGWGRSEVFRAFDAGLVALFLIVFSEWSRRRFSTRLPGAVGGLIFLSDYLGLDYAHAGQRDWHATMLAAASLMILQAGRGRLKVDEAAFVFALALSVRPQVVLFLPALVSTFFLKDESRADGSATHSGHFGRFCLALALGVWLLSVPLALSKVLPDFLSSLEQVFFGASYNRVSPLSLVRSWLLQMAEWRRPAVPMVILLLSKDAAVRRFAIPWLLMLAGATLYKPISPLAHSYLDIPLMLVLSVNAAVLVGVVLNRVSLPSEVRLAVTLLCLGLGVTTLYPKFCALGPSWRACRAFWNGHAPSEQPPGYWHGTVATSAYYPWNDYRDLIHSLRQTKPTMPIANMLKGDPAITAMVDRPSVFPAESIAWLRMVRRQDEPRFAEALEACDEALVLWVPGENGPDPTFRIDRIEEVVRRRFHFERRFGEIEVWSREP